MKKITYQYVAQVHWADTSKGRSGAKSGARNGTTDSWGGEGIIEGEVARMLPYFYRRVVEWPLSGG